MIHISGHIKGYRIKQGLEDAQNAISINSCGYQKFLTRDYTEHRENGRKDYQIQYIARGKGTFKINNCFTEIPEGNIVIYRPGQEQYYEYLCADSTEVYWIHFSGYSAGNFLLEADLAENPVYYIGLHDDCIDLFEKIMNELQIRRSMFIKLTAAYFYELMALFPRYRIEIDGVSNRSRDASIQEVIKIMHSKYNLKYSVVDFAKHLNLSNYRFIHSFRALTGIPPMEYLTRVRIDKARELLTGSSMSINQISSIIGYDNPLYFSRVFRKISGVSPSVYRKSSYMKSNEN